jgi:hypothetical protein
MDDERKIDGEELRSMFGDEIPMWVIQFIWNEAPGTMTIGQARAELRRRAIGQSGLKGEA